MAKRREGRPTSLTPETQKKIISCILTGAYIETAACFAGISKNTLYDWLKRGARDSSGPYREFSDAVEKAMADSELTDLVTINNATKKGQWQAAAWRLERKHPARWGRRTEIDLGKDTAQTLTDWLAKVLTDKG